MPKESNELAQVLSRINALTQHGKAQVESPVSTESPVESIPQLTEVYDGEPLIFISHSDDEFPTLNEFVGNAVTDAEAVLEQAKILQAEKLEDLLAQTAPLIQAAIKKAALRKIIDVEPALQTQILAEVMQTLRERLQSLV